MELLTIDFLVLRMNSLGNLLLRKFYRRVKYNGRPELGRVYLGKRRPDKMKIMRIINDIVVQFKQVRAFLIRETN